MCLFSVSILQLEHNKIKSENKNKILIRKLLFLSMSERREKQIINTKFVTKEAQIHNRNKSSPKYEIDRKTEFVYGVVLVFRLTNSFRVLVEKYSSTHRQTKEQKKSKNERIKEEKKILLNWEGKKNPQKTRKIQKINNNI